MGKVLSSKNAAENVFMRVLMVGSSGAGKTTCAARAPKPLILEPAHQAVTSIQAARPNRNPDAITFLLDDMEDLEDAVYSIRNAQVLERDGKPALGVHLRTRPGSKKPEADYGKFVVQTVVLDDLEEIQEMIRRNFLSEKTDMSQNDWMKLFDKCFELLRAVRSSPVNFIVCSKMIFVQDDDKQIMELALYGKKFKPLLPGLFNCMCYLYRRDPTESDARRHVAGFNLPEKYLTKPHPALESIEDPDPTVWWDKIRGWEGGTEITPKKPEQDQLPVDPGMKPKPALRRR